MKMNKVVANVATTIITKINPGTKKDAHKIKKWIRSSIDQEGLKEYVKKDLLFDISVYSSGDYNRFTGDPYSTSGSIYYRDME